MIDVALFAEDDGHSEFIAPLIERVADNAAVAMRLDVRNSSGGKPQAIRTLRDYASDMREGRALFAQILVVAVDSDCETYATRRGEIERVVGEYAGRLLVAVPEPHVERWYLLDPTAPAQALGVAGAAPQPDKLCERYRYKGQLREAFRQMGVDPPAGGIFYGGDIARLMDLQAARRFSADFDRFVDDLEAAFAEQSA